MDALHIKNFKGKSGEIYTPDLFYRFPYEEDFSEKNCICIFITRYCSDEIISCYIEFNEVVNKDTYKDIDIKGFKPYGIAMIKSTKKDSDFKINDLKGNKNFYFENPPIENCFE